jgi:hypothetical protein
MKKKTAILLFSLFVFDITGYFIVFNVQRCIIRSNIKQQIRKELPPEQLTLIVDSGIGKTELRWKEKGEFRYHGEMYDVVRSEVKQNGITNYYCIADKAETQLYRQLAAYIRMNVDDQDNSIQGKLFLIKIYHSIYLTFTNRFTVILQMQEINNSDRVNFYQSQPIDVDRPPPKITIPA